MKNNNILQTVKKGWKKFMKKEDKNAYLWYSAATDITGKKLAEELGISHGSDKPKGKKLVIGWGAKTKNAVELPGATVLNHPNSIRENRNKFTSMAIMKDSGVNIAEFVDADHIKDIKQAGGKKGVILPVIGRKKYHQGGKGFWTCPTMTHVKEAINSGAQYFQNLIEIDSEYRFHVFGGKVIYAVKKVKRTVQEMEEAYIRHETERQTELAKKNGNNLDVATMEIFLKRQAKKFAQDGANMLVRSNRLGWKFAKVNKPAPALVAEALKAIDALKLQFGAVDGCIDASGKAWIFEVNTGPGLEQSPFKSYTEAFAGRIKEILTDKPAVKPVVAPKVVAAKPVGLKKAAITTKASLQEKMRLAGEMVNVASEEEAKALESVFKKVFG